MYNSVPFLYQFYFENYTVVDGLIFDRTHSFSPYNHMVSKIKLNKLQYYKFADID